MTVHFVCIGNTYRSRIAAAYFNSLHTAPWTAVSSGVQAERNLNGPICRYTAKLLEENNLRSFDSQDGWTQTSRENLKESNLTVFMNKECFDLCRENPGFIPERYEIWNIPDLETEPKSETNFIKTLEGSRRTLQKIEQRVDTLVKTLLFD